MNSQYCGLHGWFFLPTEFCDIKLMFIVIIMALKTMITSVESHVSILGVKDCLINKLTRKWTDSFINRITSQRLEIMNQKGLLQICWK